jgi:hypothetical protein
MKKEASYIKDRAKSYKKIIIWGVRNERPGDSFHYIHDHFYTTFQKLGIEPIWVDDFESNRSLVEEGSFVMGFNLAGKYLPVVDGVDYCLHNFDEVGDIHKQIGSKRNIRLQVYTSKSAKNSEKWNEVTYFDRKSRTLFQPWGTNLMPDEFLPPVVPKFSPFLFWIGSVWNDEQNQGNVEYIKKLKKVLKKHHIIFKQLRVNDDLNIRLTRMSRISPAIGGKWQVDNNYLPCRMFKNISYGQLGVSNIPKFKDMFGSSYVEGETLEELIENSLIMPRRKILDIVQEQQEVVRKHTYVTKIHNIFKALEGVR